MQPHFTLSQCVRTYLDDVHFPEAELLGLLGQFEPVQWQAGTSWLVPQAASRYLLLLQGQMQLSTPSMDGSEVTLAFYTAPRAVFEPLSFFTQTPSSCRITALTDGRGYTADFAHINQLFHQSAAFRTFGRAVLVRELVRQQAQHLFRLQHSAEEVYAQLLQEHPGLLQHSSLRSIASYIGITDSSLSRIRKQWVQKS